MNFDIIRDRAMFSALRRIATKVPLVWSAYGAYWHFRQKLEARYRWRSDPRILDFGNYPTPTLLNPSTQLCTAGQMTSDVYHDWCKRIFSPARFSRKQWEFVYIMQALELSGLLEPGRRGLGFGCGREPLPGLFAKAGVDVLATDLAAPDAVGRGWVETMQHASSLEELYTASRRIIDRKSFSKRVVFEAVDMNNIPSKFDGKFDFVWSACALEHLGSLQHGIDFIRNSSKCLKVGGVAVHTTEFNLSSNDKTLEQPECSIYRRQDIERCRDILSSDGFELAPINLNTGVDSVDRYVDVPPYSMSPHIRLDLESYVVTSIGIIIRRMR